MYRVYDIQKREWVRNNIYISPNGDLYIEKNTLFGKRLKLASQGRYVVHRSTETIDIHNVEIYEGDICISESLNIVGVVVYSMYDTTYYLYNDIRNEYYSLATEDAKDIKVIGNVFNIKNK